MIDPVMLTRKNLSDLTNSSPHSTCSVLLRIYRLESYYNSSYSGCKSLGPTILLPIQANSKTATSDSQKRPTTLSYNDQSHCSESTPRHRLGRSHGWHSHQASSQQSRDRHTADGESEMSHSRIELQVERGEEYASAFPLVTDSLLGTSLLSRGNLDAHRLPSMLLAESVGEFLT